MIRILPVLLALLFWSIPAHAQNPQCPTRPAGDSTNACASTAFVQGAVAGGGIITAPVYFKNGQPWTDVKAWGAKGDSSTNDHDAIQAAIDYMAATYIGGTVFFPVNVSNAVYCTFTTITVTGSNSLALIGGGGHQVSQLSPCEHDIATLVLDAAYTRLENIGVQARGGGTLFGGTHPAITVTSGCSQCQIKNVLAAYGSTPFAQTGGADVRVMNSFFTLGYGVANMYFQGSTAGARITGSTVDQNWPVTQPTYPYTINAWAGTTAYVIGDVVSTGGYLIQASVAGTSGGVAPTLKNYFQDIVDGAGTLRWRLASPDTFDGVKIDSGASEVDFIEFDVTGAFKYGIHMVQQAAGTAPFYVEVSNSVLSQHRSAGIYVENGGYFTMNNTHVRGCVSPNCSQVNIGVSSNNPNFLIQNSFEFGATGVSISGGVNNILLGNYAANNTQDYYVSPNVNDFIINSNISTSTFSVVVDAGTSNRYSVQANKVTNAILDNGTGTTKCVANNVGSTLNKCPNGTAPAISAGLCTSPSISANNGAQAFDILVGSACAGSTGTLTFPAATTGWNCTFANVTNPAANFPQQTGGTSTTVVITNYVRTTGVAGNFTAADHIRGTCSQY